MAMDQTVVHQLCVKLFPEYILFVSLFSGINCRCIPVVSFDPEASEGSQHWGAELIGISKQLPKATQLPKAAHARVIWGQALQDNFEF